ncbi:DNA polymerase III subunit psi [Spirabiliibacterium falconis]|uniref:DNA polymerase III subunit psi n=1 Tax=Spirabiliibacterium falconis TaxID=572023 RepID=UPI001AAC81BA|nr:DNA polymerase III subunit psi [Spirabiliibacterium falconis]MBE2893813.1 hypothetical protein [Spirabiliibacterium falconis]
MSRQQFLLAQMGISTWHIRRPQVFQGASQLQLSHDIKLLIVQDNAQLPHPFFADILRTLTIQAQHCHVATPEQLSRLACQHPISLWFVGTQAKLHAFNASYVQSQLELPDWTTLKTDKHAKRQLWQQLQESPLLREDNHAH